MDAHANSIMYSTEGDEVGVLVCSVGSRSKGWVQRLYAGRHCTSVVDKICERLQTQQSQNTSSQHTFELLQVCVTSTKGSADLRPVDGPSLTVDPSDVFAQCEANINPELTWIDCSEHNLCTVNKKGWTPNKTQTIPSSHQPPARCKTPLLPPSHHSSKHCATHCR